MLQYCACVTPQQINIHVNISKTYSMSEKYWRGSYPKSLLYLCNRSDLAAPPRAPARGCWASCWFSLDMPVVQTQPGEAERFLHEKGQKNPPLNITATLWRLSLHASVAHCRRRTCGVHWERQMFHSMHPSVEVQVAPVPGLAVVVLCVRTEQQYQEP